MTTTGYQVKQGTKKLYWCEDHIIDAPISTRDNRCVAIETGQFAFGDGGKPCVVCGTDINDILVTKDRATVVPAEDRDYPLSLVAQLIDEKFGEAFVLVQPAPGETPDETQIVDGVTVVEQDCEETVYVEYPKDAVTDIQSHMETIQTALEACGLHTDMLRQYPDEDYWTVIAAPP